jgi:chromosome segregation ATPase
MAGIIKTLIRVGVITAASAGAAVLIAGPDRAAALVSQTREKIMDTIDERIEDPVALRNQLRELERDYPQRISQVRGDLAELQEQMRQLDRDRAVSERVIALADRDLATLGPALDEAEAVQAEAASFTGVRTLASVQFDSRTYTLEQARSRAHQIAQTRVAYANRAADAAHDLIYLQQQEERLDKLLAQLEHERTQFQSQLWQLDRQVDAIARNENLIEMLEKRKQTIEECSRYEVGTLDQMVARLAEVRARQQAELDVLSGQDGDLDYEEVAKMQLGSEQGLVRVAPLRSSEAPQVPPLLFSTPEHAAPKLR